MICRLLVSVFLALSLAPHVCVAQELPKQEVDRSAPPKNHFGFSEGLALAPLGNRFGYIDPSGRWSIAPRFLFGSAFENGIARVRMPTGQWGLIDVNGEWVAPPVSRAVLVWPNGHASLIGREGQHTLVNATGRVLAGPHDFTMSNNEDFIVYSDNGLMGVKRSDGTVIEPPVYKSISMLGEDGKTYAVSNDLLTTSIRRLDGKEVAELPYGVGQLVGGAMQIFDDSTQLIGLAGPKGNVLIEPKYRSVIDMSTTSGDLVFAKPDGMNEIVSKNGKIVFRGKEHVNPLSPFGENGLALARNDEGLLGFINRAGEWQIDPKYRSASRFGEGLAFVELTDRTIAWIDESGKFRLGPIDPRSHDGPVVRGRSVEGEVSKANLRAKAESKILLDVDSSIKEVVFSTRDDAPNEGRKQLAVRRSHVIVSSKVFEQLELLPVVQNGEIIERARIRWSAVKIHENIRQRVLEISPTTRQQKATTQPAR